MRKHLLPLALIFLIALLFAPLCRTFVREVVVIPFLYIFWLGRVLTEFIPQTSLWPVFVLLIFLIMATSFLGHRARRGRVKPAHPPEPGRVERWAFLLARAQNDNYFKWRLGQQLQKLALRAIAHQKGQSIKETRLQLRQGDLNLPPELQTFFEASLQPLGYLAANRRFGFWRGRRRPSPLDLDPQRVVAFLENLDQENN